MTSLLCYVYMDNVYMYIVITCHVFRQGSKVEQNRWWIIYTLYEYIWNNNKYR